VRPIYNYVVAPVGDRYNNKVDIGDKSLILNTEVYSHQHVNREARVISVPIIESHGINIGDTIIVHFNVFRRWHDVKGKERNSRSFMGEDKYIVAPDQVFLHKPDTDTSEWECTKGYCFVQPIESIGDLTTETEEPLVGVVKHTDGTVSKGEIVGFKPGTECEFVVNQERLYRIPSQFITIKYEYQGNEKTYNPSWA
jgi:hypothetical protein